ncbi:MAG: polysaccharide deacetylase family protein [Gaiellales bacterium]
MLVVEAPRSREPERTYALDLVLGHLLGLEHSPRFTERTDWCIRVAGSDEELVLPDALLGIPDEEWLTPASLPQSITPGGPPLVFSGTTSAGTLCDPFATVFFLLTRYEERALRLADALGRFPAGCSLVVRAGLGDRPLADECAEWLWEQLVERWPRLERRRGELTVALTHDVDWVSTVRQPLPRVVRLVGGDALRRRDPLLAARRARAALRVRLGRRDVRDPADTFELLMRTSEEVGLRSAFFFIAPTPGAAPFHNEGYDLARPDVRRLLREIHDRGHELGLHGAFSTHTSAASLRTQLATLVAAARAEGVEQEAWGGRQHFLQFEAPTTWACWEEAGLAYDSSLAFAEAPGFRCGTTRPFPVFDLDARRQLRLVEQPLIAMEGSFLDPQYLGLPPDEAAARMLELARMCKRYGGRFTLLWHNTALVRAADRSLYRDLVRSLASL